MIDENPDAKIEFASIVEEGVFDVLLEYDDSFKSWVDDILFVGKGNLGHSIFILKRSNFFWWYTSNVRFRGWKRNLYCFLGDFGGHRKEASAGELLFIDRGSCFAVVLELRDENLDVVEELNSLTSI